MCESSGRLDCTYIRLSLHDTVVAECVYRTLPNRVFTGWCIGLLGIVRFVAHYLRGTIRTVPRDGLPRESNP